MAAARHKAGIISGSEHESARQTFCGQQQQLLLAKKADVLAAVDLAKALGW